MSQILTEKELARRFTDYPEVVEAIKGLWDIAYEAGRNSFTSPPVIAEPATDYGESIEEAREIFEHFASFSEMESWLSFFASKVADETREKEFKAFQKMAEMFPNHTLSDIGELIKIYLSTKE